MRLKNNFSVYNIADDYMLIPTGDKMATFGGTIVLNEVSAFLINQMKEEDRTLDQLVQAVLNEYDVDESTARTDVTEAIEKLKQTGVIDE